MKLLPGRITISRGEKMVLAVVIIATLVAGLAISVLTALEGHPYLPLIGQ